MDMVRYLVDTEDWESFGDDTERYLSYINDWCVWPTPENQTMFAQNLRKWAANYRPSFMSLRKTFKDISSDNHKRLGLPTIMRDGSKMNRNTIALVTDDDDWYNPEVVSEVWWAFKEHPEMEVVYWDCWQYQTVWNAETFSLFTLQKYGSNSFAIRGGRSYEFFRWGVHNRVEEQIPDDKCLHLPGRHLSLWNIHPASFCQRINYPLSDKINVLKRTKIPDHFKWATKEINAFYEALTSIQKIS